MLDSLLFVVNNSWTYTSREQNIDCQNLSEGRGKWGVAIQLV